MYRGELPGLYWDDGKKKYFTIQANHIAPADAKYSQSNVDQEKREVKKRRLEKKHQQRVRKERVPAARLLRNPILGGTGLRREHGDRSLAFYHAQRDSAFVDHLERLEHREVFLPVDWGFSDTLWLKERYQALSAVSQDGARYSISLHARASAGEEWPYHQPLSAGMCLHGFRNPVIGLDATQDVVVAFTGKFCPNAGNIFVGSLNSPGLVTATNFNIGRANETLWDCKLAKETINLAVATTSAISIYAVTPTGASRLTTLAAQDGSEFFALDWLNNSTVAVGTIREEQTSRRFPTPHHEVLLWDCRSSGRASRIKLEHRVNGIYTPNNSGNHLLVSSSRQISLYDLRILRPDAPLLSINHLSGTTRLHTPTHGDLVAATDKDNKMQMYSIRTGRHLRTLVVPQARGQLQRPRWQEDHRGTPYLQACALKAPTGRWNTVQRWKWNRVDKTGLSIFEDIALDPDPVEEIALVI